MSKVAREVSKEERDKLADKGKALPSGGYPIANVADLKNAIQAFGRAKNKAQTKAHIIKRAKALGRTDLLPEDWEGSTKKKESSEVFAENVGNLLDFIKQCNAEPEWDAAVISTGLSFAELTSAFLNRLRDLVKSKVKDGDLSKDDWEDAVKKARAHAGGKAKAAKAKAPIDDSEEEEMQSGGESFDVFDLCREGGPFRFFYELPQVFATPPEWIPLLPKPGKYKHPDYGLIELDDTRIDRFISNINESVYQSKLPINAEHKPSDDGALGWITEARLNTDGSVDGKASWTDLGKEAIENDRFQYISPEWLDVWKQASTGKVIKDVLVGAALTVRPFFKEDSMRPLIASEKGWMTLGDGEVKKLLQTDGNCVIFATTLTEVKEMAESQSKQCAMPGCEEDAMPGKKYCEAHMKEKGMAEEVTSEVKQASEKIAALETQVKTLSETATAQAEQLKVATEQLKVATETIGQQNNAIAQMQSDARRKRFSELVKGFQGKPENHVRRLEMFSDIHKLSEGKCSCGTAECKGGEESSDFTDYLTEQKAFAEQIRLSKEFGAPVFGGEIGSSQGGSDQSAEAKLEAGAKSFHEKHPEMTYQQAYAEFTGTPEGQRLYGEYRKEVS